MLFRIIFLLLILAGIFYFYAAFRKLDGDSQKQWIKRLLVSALLGGLLVLVLSGRLNVLFAAAGALLPLIPRVARLLVGVWPSVMPYFKRHQENKLSSMQSRFIRLQIDILSGALQGEVLEGEYTGRKLQSMSVDELLQLLEQCKQQDADSAALLMAYLDHSKPGWSASGSKEDNDTYRRKESSTVMSDHHAREILGVSDEASEKEIVKAHKRLMQKMHPDRGGSVYLAKQINAARDALLEK